MSLAYSGMVCMICGADDCACSTELHRVKALFEEPPVPYPAKGRWFRTTERVIRNGRLVIGAGIDIPYPQALALGLVEPDVVPDSPLAPEAAEVVEAHDEEDEGPAEVSAAPEATQAIVRRSSKRRIVSQLRAS